MTSFGNAYEATPIKCGHRVKKPHFTSVAYLEQNENIYTLNRPHLLSEPNIFNLDHTLKPYSYKLSL